MGDRLLQLDPGLEQFLPGLRKGFDANLFEPVYPIIHELADIAERNGFPFAVDDHGLGRGIVPAAALLTDSGCDVGQITSFSSNK